MYLLFLLAFTGKQPEIPQCVIDRCEGNVCIVETPEGIVDIPKKAYYREGTPIVCPLWLIDPT